MEDQQQLFDTTPYETDYVGPDAGEIYEGVYEIESLRTLVAVGQVKDYLRTHFVLEDGADLSDAVLETILAGPFALGAITSAMRARSYVCYAGDAIAAHYSWGDSDWASAE